MTSEQLKASVLKYAFEGKLVEQIKQNKTVEDEIAELGITVSYISDEEKDERIIPDTWGLVKLKDLVTIYTGKKDANYGSPDGIYDFFTCSAEPIKSKDYSYEGEYLIMPGNGANIGMVIYYNGKFEAYQRTYLLENVHSIDMKYLKYHLESNWKSYNSDKMFGSAIPYIKLGNLQNYIVSFPPIEEQHRIVTKIEEILPLIEKYAEAYEKLEKFNAKFPEDMKNSILQYAIQGKLVEQKAEEGTAEELYRLIEKDREQRIRKNELKKDKRMSLEDMPIEKPFDIPENWKWVTLGSILLKLTDGTHKTPKYQESGIKFVSVKDMSSGVLSLENTKFISEEEHEQLVCRCDPQNGDMLLSKVGTTGVPAIVDTDEPFSLFVSVSLLKYNHNYIYEKFLYYLLQSPLVQEQASENTRGVGNKNWVLDAIAKTLIILPPYDEQKRIVEELEKLLPLCDSLI